MSDSVTVEFQQTARVLNMETGPLALKGCVIARVFPLPKGRSRKPIISLVGDDWRGAAEQVRMWFENGRPTTVEATAGAEDR